jgi:YegS/Rv2252/BmrU family lipid kinase
MHEIVKRPVNGSDDDMTRSLSIAVILNRAGGTLKALDADEVAGSVERGLKDAGHSVASHVADPGAVTGHLERCLSEGSFDAVIVGGGDGTVSAAAATLAGSDVALGVLPLGTLNLFARSLGIPIDLDQAVVALATGDVRSVDLGDVNGRKFVNHVSQGLHPRVIRLREVSGYSSRMGKLWADFRALLRVVSRPRPLDIVASANGDQIRRRVSMAVVANNPFGQGPGHLPHSDDPAAGTLALYLSGSLTRKELLQMSGAAMLGQWHDNPLLEMVTAKEIEMRSRTRRVVTSVDGEIVRMSQPMVFRSLAGGLKVLAPSGAARADF